MNKNMLDKGYSRFDVEYFFIHNRFDIEYVEKMYLLCQLLGLYTFLDRFLIEEMAKGIGLEIIKFARHYGLVIESQEETEAKGKKPVFYFNLGTGGLNLLRQTGDHINPLFLAAGRQEKSRLLTVNYFMYENNLKIKKRENQDKKHRYFTTSCDKILYFKDSIKKRYIAQKMADQWTSKEIRQHGDEARTFTVDDVLEIVDFIEINRERVQIGERTRTTLTDKI